MNLATFYLVCFVVGFVFSVLSFLMGMHMPGKFHLPHFGMHNGGHLHVHLPHAGGYAAPGGGANDGAHAGGEVSPVNTATLMAFLTWFGGIGYILTRYSALLGIFALLLAVVGGLGGASLIFLFMAKVLVRPDESMDPADYEMVGTLGRLTVGIRAGGTGEIVYTQGGTRKSAAARAEDGSTMEKGSEVAVTRFEKGIAYVRRWEDLTGEDSATPADEAEKQQ
jgi:membrane protein implicated in regulation of membrane protease activity